MDAQAKPLPRNQQLVLDVLSQSDGPLSAYAILDQLRPAGLKAPLQVYRALEKLTGQGFAHRLESLNAFVACSHPHCGGHKSSAFAICDDCGDVREYTDKRLDKLLSGLSDGEGFTPSQSIVEMHGICSDCGDAKQGDV